MSEPTRLGPELEERLARYRAGALTAAEREAFEREVLGSDVLAEELYAELELDAVRTTAAPAVVPLRPRAAWPRLVVPAAAAVMIVAALSWWSLRTRVAPHDDTLRGDAVVPMLLEPVGALAVPPDVLRWNAAPTADRYRVDLYDPAGMRFGTVVTRDTVVAVRALTAERVTAGEWRVVPIDGRGLDGPVLGRATFRVDTTR